MSDEPVQDEEAGALDRTDPNFPNVDKGWYSEADWSAPYDRQPHPERFHTEDIQTAEFEVHDLVRGLVRGSQPGTCLETGTSRGMMAATIARALLDNMARSPQSDAVLVTYEPNTDTYNEALAHFRSFEDPEFGEPIDLPITALNEKSMQPWNNGPIDFAWFDSDIGLRVEEFRYYERYMSAGALACFHDTAPRFGGWSDNLRLILNRQRWRCIDFPSPRGVIIASRL